MLFIVFVRKVWKTVVSSPIFAHILIGSSDHAAPPPPDCIRTIHGGKSGSVLFLRRGQYDRDIVEELDVVLNAPSIFFPVPVR